MQKQDKIRNGDLEKILNYGSFSYTEITTDFDEELGYILDVKDSGYFYTEETDPNEKTVTEYKTI